jgi:phytoene/squalene synthetase
MASLPHPSSNPSRASSGQLARSITRRASHQTYHTIRWLVDRGRTDDAFRAYAYFRWVDDVLDAPRCERAARLAFLDRQRQLLSGLLSGLTPGSLQPEELMLADLISGQRGRHPGLRSYLERMMAVMEFDAGRRGRLITEIELDRYSQLLGAAVMDAIAYFIGHDHRYPESPARTQAVVAAHIIHMLRDTHDDLQAGYFNVPRGLLEAEQLTPGDVQHPAYRLWVRTRIEAARRGFAEGKAYIRRMGSLRAQLAGYLYCARFEIMLRRIALDGYRLRDCYDRPPPLPALMARWVRQMRTAMYGPRRAV